MNGAGRREATTRERQCALAPGLAAGRTAATVQLIENEQKRIGMELSAPNSGVLNGSISRKYANFSLCPAPAHIEIVAPVASQEAVF